MSHWNQCDRCGRVANPLSGNSLGYNVTIQIGNQYVGDICPDCIKPIIDQLPKTILPFLNKPNPPQSQ